MPCRLSNAPRGASDACRLAAYREGADAREPSGGADRRDERSSSRTNTSKQGDQKESGSQESELLHALRDISIPERMVVGSVDATENTNCGDAPGRGRRKRLRRLAHPLRRGTA
jgi:hypothetical protein